MRNLLSFCIYITITVFTVNCYQPPLPLSPLSNSENNKSSRLCSTESLPQNGNLFKNRHEWLKFASQQPKCLIAIHGLGSDSSSFTALKEHLSSKMLFNKCTNYYFPNAPKNEKNIPLREAKKFIEEAKSKEHIDKDTYIYLVAHSRGGLVAILMADLLEKEGYKVHGVCLYGTPLLGVMLLKNVPAINKILKYLDKSLLRFLQKQITALQSIPLKSLEEMLKFFKKHTTYALSRNHPGINALLANSNSLKKVRAIISSPNRKFRIATFAGGGGTRYLNKLINIKHPRLIRVANTIITTKLPIDRIPGTRLEMLKKGNELESILDPYPYKEENTEHDGLVSQKSALGESLLGSKDNCFRIPGAMHDYIKDSPLKETIVGHPLVATNTYNWFENCTIDTLIKQSTKSAKASKAENNTEYITR